VKNTYTLKISRAKLTEIYEIVEVEKDCCLESWATDEYKKEMTKVTSLILTAKYKTESCTSEIAGFITSRFTAPITVSDKTEMYEELDILNFGVLKKYRQKGIGSSLLDCLIERASRMGVESIWLEVRESNLEALSFYKKKGFSAIQMRKNFYREPLENALVLKLDVKN
jgi:ribosomal-protein-alanine acetyltransferase